MKKIIKSISVVLVLLLTVAAFAACNNKPAETTADTADYTPVDTGEVIGGGWTVSEKAVDGVSAEDKAVFEKALSGEGIGVGVDYTAVDVLAKQSVAGWKYAFLCIKKAVVPNAVPAWCVLTVYEGLDGSASVNGIIDIDVANVRTKENSTVGENTSGGWEADVNEAKLSVSERVDGALGSYEGMNLKPIAVLGTQVVAGTNYKVLAYGAPVVPDAIYDLYVVDVYDAIGGEAEISSVKVFDLHSYVS